MNQRLLRPLARPSGLVVHPTAPDPFATLTSTKSTGNVSVAARSTTGYIKVAWWDSTSNVYGSGSAGSYISCLKAAGSAGAKVLRIYPSDASGNLDGALTGLSCGSNSLTSLDVSGCTALTNLYCNNNALTSLDVSGLTALNGLSCDNNAIASLDVSGLAALTNLSCSGNSLTSLDVSGLTALNSLVCNNNALASLDASGCAALYALYCNNNALTSLDVSGCTTLAVFNCNDNALTSLDVSGCTALVELFCNDNALTSLNANGLTSLVMLHCNNNNLTSLRAVGVPGLPNFYGYAYYTSPSVPGIMAANNSLGATALDQLYADLADHTPTGFYAILFVGGNPGTASDNPSIATAKNWVVLGS